MINYRYAFESYKTRIGKYKTFMREYNFFDDLNTRVPMDNEKEPLSSFLSRLFGKQDQQLIVKELSYNANPTKTEVHIEVPYLTNHLDVYVVVHDSILPREILFECLREVFDGYKVMHAIERL